MSGQPPYQINEPYSTTLSLLRRIDVLRLCLEFKISSEGTVVFLKKQIKKYLNDHRETLYRNPRYTPLYPKHRRPRNSPAPSFLNSNITPSHPPSPDLSYREPSPASSEESWQGIQDLRIRQPSPPFQPQPPIAPPYHEASPHFPDDYDPPIPPPSDFGWSPGPPHHVAQVHGDRKFYFFLPSYPRVLPAPIFLLSYILPSFWHICAFFLPIHPIFSGLYASSFRSLLLY